MTLFFKSKSLLKYFLLFSLLTIFSCGDDDSDGDAFENVTQLASKTFQLFPVEDPSISGTAKFIKNSNETVTVEIQLIGAEEGNLHPAHIHFNTAAEGGDIAITLQAVEGETGFSTTTFDVLDDDTIISYEELLDFDGYINVHFSESNLEDIIAQGDIGQNELTGTTKSYALGSVDFPAISGNATFSQRVNNETLVTINLEETPASGEHPAHIHFNTAAETGAIAYSLNTVDGTTGESKTNIDAISYNNLLDFDGYINVHLSDTNLDVLLAQGDIGQNELTGTSVTYNLSAVSDPSIMGDITFFERFNGEALAVIDIINTPNGAMHPAHIHAGSVATAPGAILFTFTPVNGDNGVSKTNVAMLDNGTSFVYNDVLTVDGYVNVHESMDNLAVLVAQGNIGANN
ncbi:hypothetical protein [Lacinutrix sp. MedPE-SW]|uniref:hypothetical protein n=1 Tax=Lacinutrix sp. MedPE-SW TaxID=1860087 RepID=UPI0009143E1B|nr:hypothetical protein [Lacinutrix sp. MedPE-SW]OIQ22890.1 MAG: hypothetical protein BM549_05030 [Lacinutrix sp. MedPE-SW]